MFKRLFWLMVGAGFGFGASFWANRALRRTLARYTPDRLAAVLADAAREAASGLRQRLDASPARPALRAVGASVPRGASARPGTGRGTASSRRRQAEGTHQVHRVG